MSYQKRSSTEPEPTTVDGIFAIVSFLVVIGCFVALWSETATELCRMAVLWVARSH